MKIALPTSSGKLCAHFGHCEKFVFVSINTKDKKIISKDLLTPPAHEPGILPTWVKENGADIVIAGGMGQRAQALFEEKGIKVVVGCQKENIEEIISDYLNDNLKIGSNICDH